MVTVRVDSARIVGVVLAGELSAGTVSVLGAAVVLLMAAVVLLLPFYFGGSERSPTEPGESSLDHETRGERSRGLLVEVTDGDRSEQFFVRDRTGPNPSVSTASPPSSGDGWVAAGREYLRERAIRGDLTAGETDPGRADDALLAGLLVATTVVGTALAGFHYLLGSSSLEVSTYSFLRVADAVAGGTSVFDATAADAVRYLVFAGGALAVLQESDHRAAPVRLAAAVFAAAVALPSGVLLALGVGFDVEVAMSTIRNAVFPTVAVLGFREARGAVVRESLDAFEESSRHPLVGRVSAAFRRCQRMYGRLVGLLWFAEALRGWWQYSTGPVETAALLLGEFVHVAAGVVPTMLVLTGLVLAALWVSVRPIDARRVAFAAGALSIACGALNVLSMYAVPAPVEVMAGRAVRWALVAPRSGSGVVWLLDVFNVQITAALVGFAYGTRALRRTAAARDAPSRSRQRETP